MTLARLEGGGGRPRATRRPPPGSSRARTPSCTWPRSTARPGTRTPTTARSTSSGPSASWRRRPARASAASSTPRRWASTGTSSSPRRTRRAPFAPGDIYQATKAEAERLALDFHRQRGVPVAVVRPGAIYGPGETRFLKLFRAIARGRYAIVGTGRTFYHPVYIDDLVDGFLLALDRPEAVGEAFLVCGPSYVSQSDLAALVAKHTGGRVLPFRIPARPIQWAGDLVEAICVPLGLEPPAPPAARRLLDEEPGVHDREGATAPRLRAEGGPRRGHRAHRRVVSGGGVALKAAGGPRLVLAVSSASRSRRRRPASTCPGRRRASSGATGRPTTRWPGAWPGTSTCASTPETSPGCARSTRTGRRALFLKRASGGLTVDGGGRLPVGAAGAPGRGAALLREGLRRTRSSPPRSWPSLGTRGLTLANGLLLSAGLWLGLRRPPAAGDRPVDGAGGRRRAPAASP